MCQLRPLTAEQWEAAHEVVSLDVCDGHHEALLGGNVVGRISSLDLNPPDGHVALNRAELPRVGRLVGEEEAEDDSKANGEDTLDDDCGG